MSCRREQQGGSCGENCGDPSSLRRAVWPPPAAYSYSLDPSLRVARVRSRHFGRTSASAVRNCRGTAGDSASAETDIDLAKAKVAVDQLIDPSIDATGTLKRLETMANEITARLPAHASSRDKLDALRSYGMTIAPTTTISMIPSVTPSPINSSPTTSGPGEATASRCRCCSSFSGRNWAST
jgi:hypothetical protein